MGDKGVVWVPLVVQELAEGHGGWIGLLPPAAPVRGDSPSAPGSADLQTKKGTNRSRSVCFVFPSGKRTRREQSHGANIVFTFFLVAFFM